MNSRNQNYPQKTKEFDIVEDNFKFVSYSLRHVPKMKLEKLIYCYHKHVFPKRFLALLPGLMQGAARAGPAYCAQVIR